MKYDPMESVIIRLINSTLSAILQTTGYLDAKKLHINHQLTLAFKINRIMKCDPMESVIIRLMNSTLSAILPTTGYLDVKKP